MSSFFNKARISAVQIVQQAVDKVSEQYSQAKQVFTAASPFGQILLVISNLFEMFMTYLSHALENLNIKTVHSVEGVYGLASLVGHNAFRGASSKSIINLSLNSSAPGNVKGSYVKIPNNAVLTTNNNLKFFIQSPQDFITLKMNSSEGVNVTIVEGTIEEQIFVSDGSKLQSFDVITKNMTDNFDVSVFVNDEEWTKKESLYDMNENEEAFILKTGLSAGLTVFFGNGDFGKIPDSGASIKVRYILSSGAAGNVDLTNFELKFSEPGISSTGEEVDLSQNVDIKVIENARFGADYEDVNFTRLIAPKTSKSFVLATAENYKQFLSRYNQFSFIDVQVSDSVSYLNDNNIIYITLLKDVTPYYSTGYDYFTIPEEKFLLTESDKKNIIDLLNYSGYALVNTNIVINNLTIEHYIINIIISAFEDADKNTIRTSIYDILNKYFLNVKRRDLVAKSDLISLIESIKGVDTCQVFFTSEKNEFAKKNGYYTEKVFIFNKEKSIYEISEKTITVEPDKIPNLRLGFDDVDNLVIEKNTLMLPRGGWSDYNSNFFTETYTPDKLSNLNIFFTDDTKSDMYNSDMNNKLEKLLKTSYNK